MELKPDSHDKLFFAGWNLYKKAVDNNCLFHKEMYQTLDKLLIEKFTNIPFSILDLGCGDSAYIAKILLNKSVNNYTGVDLSDFATNLAKTNLPNNIKFVDFINSDFLEAMSIMAKNQQKFDLVFTSYAFHHYQKPQKELFFKLAKQLLNDNGIVVVIDIILKESETLAAFYDRINKFYSTFNQLTAEELNGLYQHVSNSDFPETINTYKDMASNAKFTKFNVLNQQQEIFYFLTCDN